MNVEDYKSPASEQVSANEDKPWSDMTEAEIYKLKKDKCRKCQYSTRDGKSGEGIRSMTCDYIGKTGHSRGCRPDRCDKFKRRITKRGKKHE